MTSALRCDGPDCGRVVTDLDAELPRWLRLEVQGEGMPIGAGPGVLPTISLHMVPPTELLAGEPEPVEEPTTMEDLPPMRHFCGYGCLAAYAALADQVGS